MKKANNKKLEASGKKKGTVPAKRVDPYIGD